MPAVIQKNTNFPAGLGQSIIGNDSGSILGTVPPGQLGLKLVDGTQQSATTMLCDATAGQLGNALQPRTPQSTTLTATISNLALTSNVVTISCVNNFTVGQLVSLAGLTTTTAFNALTLVVLTASGSQITAALTHANIVSGAETGTITLVDWQTAAAGFSLAPQHE